MPGIICAIRGGPASQPTIDKGISLASDKNLPLYFLYIVNLEFLSRTASCRTDLISKEMYQMGEFILLMAQTQAENKGVLSEGVIRKGDLGHEIINLSQEINADFVVLGQPRGGEEDQNVFTQDLLSAFGENIERESGVEVIIAEGESE
jgi:nucleotide-binding universal stress UspA family protein